MLIIIIVGQYIAAITGISVFILQMTGYQKINRNNIIISTILSSVLGFVIIPVWGIMGTVIMTFISLLIVNTLAFYHVYYKLNINIFLKGPSCIN